VSVSISLTYEEIDYILEILETREISGGDNIRITAGLIQYLNEAKDAPVEPPQFNPQEVAPLIDALQVNLMDPLQVLWPDYPVKMDALEGGRQDGDDLVFNIFVVVGNTTHSIPMKVGLQQATFEAEFEAVKKLIETEMIKE
jgi:hypothetical protein